MEQTSIQLFGVLIQEPVTALTDLLVSFVCFRSAWLLNRNKKTEHYFSLYLLFMLVMGIATLYGGIVGHAFFYRFSLAWKLPGWIISMLSVGLAERAAIMHAHPLLHRDYGKFFRYANLVEVAFMLGVVIYTKNFFFVEVHATYGLLVVVFSFELFYFLRTREEGSRTILLAVGVSALAAIVHLSKFAISPWFNHLDLGHVLMAVSSWLFYHGISGQQIKKGSRKAALQS
jgi:hypothetical protein